ncbi:hypothetical protein [Sphingobium aquiterrae]|uniref:hypothetical protein n=1 Tax=Sphingobium aquiterrae TaxID=2038656 RepID=UPI0030174977
MTEEVKKGRVGNRFDDFLSRTRCWRTPAAMLASMASSGYSLEFLPEAQCRISP